MIAHSGNTFNTPPPSTPCADWIPVIHFLGDNALGFSLYANFSGGWAHIAGDGSDGHYGLVINGRMVKDDLPDVDTAEAYFNQHFAHEERSLRWAYELGVGVRYVAGRTELAQVLFATTQVDSVLPAPGEGYEIIIGEQRSRLDPQEYPDLAAALCYVERVVADPAPHGDPKP